MISATGIAHQTPLIPNISGSIINAPASSINVLSIEIKADTLPLFKAVKNPEANTFIPVNNTLTAIILNLKGEGFLHH